MGKLVSDLYDSRTSGDRACYYDLESNSAKSVENRRERRRRYSSSLKL
jgi:hypothetical protein